MRSGGAYFRSENWEGYIMETRFLASFGITSRKPPYAMLLVAQKSGSSALSLTSTYSNQRRWKDAEKLQAEELDICSKVLGESHPDTLISMVNLAVIWKAVGRDLEAVQLPQKCVELRTQNLGGSRPYILLVGKVN
jgi:hypothetical protein